MRVRWPLPTTSSFSLRVLKVAPQTVRGRRAGPSGNRVLSCLPSAEDTRFFAREDYNRVDFRTGCSRAWGVAFFTALFGKDRKGLGLEVQCPLIPDLIHPEDSEILLLSGAQDRAP